MFRGVAWVLSMSLVAPPALARDEAPAAPGVYDVSGANGRKDPDGAPSHHPGDDRGRGRDGHHGGHASEARTKGRLDKKGWDGGRLNLNLSVENDRTIVVTGDKVGPENTYHHHVVDRMKLRDTDRLIFRARGGRGGDGGHGGRGQDGGRGHDGADATMYSWGGDGDDGGHGGAEGHSTDGGPAGRGGDITLTVPVEDADLAMLFAELDVRGNVGGARGVGRGAGAGGAGGSGGSSYSWVTFESHLVPSLHTDDDGSVHVEMVEETVPVPHYNPGGSDGARGRDGARSARTTVDGADGPGGRYLFRTRDETGRIHDHPRGAYDLRLLPFRLEGSHNSGDFFEPGETVTVRDLRVINVGGSPTPKYQRVKLFMTDNAEWIRSDGLELTLPRVLAPGEEYNFGAEPLRFHLVEKPRFARGRLQAIDFVGPRARVTRVEKEFPDFAIEARRKINVRYPVEITPLQSLVTIAPGEAERVLFRVTNISTQTIGWSPERPHLRRAETRFARTDGSTAPRDAVITETIDGPAVDPKRGITRALEGLAPGASVIVESFVGFKPNAANYSRVTIQPELFLESILEPGRINRVHFEPYELRVSKAFQYDEDADVLLVANHGLDAKMLDAFEATAALKQLRMNIWDFSRYGFFDFGHRVEDYGPIFEAYRGKTIIVLGNPTRTPKGEVRPHDLLAPDQIIAAARRYGIKVVICDTSDDQRATVARLTEPTPLDPRAIRDPNDLREFKSPRHYAREFRSAIHEVQEALGDVTSFLGISRVAVTETPILPWRQPTSANLRRAGERALAATERFAPEARVFVDYEFKPTVIGTRFWLWKRWSLGSLKIRRSVDESKTSVVAIHMPTERLEDPDFILGDEFQTAFDFALNFQTKLGIFNDVVMGKYNARRGEIRLPARYKHLRARAPMEYARVLTHSLLLDLLHEQITIRPFERATRVDNLWTKLDLLKKLTHYDYTQFKLDPHGEEGQLFVDLVVAMRFFNQAATTAWERWFSFGLTQNQRVSRVSDQLLDRLVNGVFEDVPVATEIIDARVRELKKRAKAEKIGREELVNFLDDKGLGRAVKRDGQVHRDPAARVRDEGRQRELHVAERVRRHAAAGVRKAVRRETRLHRLSAAECARLLGGEYAPAARAAR